METLEKNLKQNTRTFWGFLAVSILLTSKPQLIYADFVKPLSRKAQGILKKKKNHFAIDCNQKKKKRLRNNMNTGS